MLTNRDMEVVDFIKQFKAVDTKTITQLYYPCERKTQQRMVAIIKETPVNRMRQIINEPYIYFYKSPPAQLRHTIKVAEFYKVLNRKYQVKKFNIEPQYGSVRPDAAFVYIENGMQKVGLLEVELSNKGFNKAKYDNWLTHSEYKKFMTIPPHIFVIQKIKASTDDSHYTYIDTDLCKWD